MATTWLEFSGFSVRHQVVFNILNHQQHKQCQTAYISCTATGHFCVRVAGQVYDHQVEITVKNHDNLDKLHQWLSLKQDSLSHFMAVGEGKQLA